MTYLVLHADTVSTTLTDDPVVPAAQLPALSDAIALLAESGRQRAAAADAVAEGRTLGHAEGYEAGHAEGRAAAEVEAQAEMFRLAMRDGEARRQRQGELTALAIEVVRRIAGDVGPDALIAGMAERAVHELAPDTVAVVRVAPARVDAVRARLSGRDGIAVQADGEVAADDCVIETSLGRTHAGLETQLGRIVAAWSERGAGHGA